MLLQNILSSSGSFRLVAKLQQKSEIFSFSQLFLLVLQHIFRKGGSVDRKGETRKPNFTAVTFSREAVKFFSKAVKFFSKAVKFSRAAVTFYLLPFTLLPLPLLPFSSSLYRDSLTRKDPTHVAHVAPGSSFAGLWGQEVLGRDGRRGWDVFRFSLPIRARGRMLRQKISIA